MSDELDRSHVPDYVSPEGPKDLTPPSVLDRSYLVPYVSPSGPKDETPPGVLDHGYIKELYVSPIPEPEAEPEPDPEQLARETRIKELREHAELVQRMQEEDRKRAAKSVEPTSIEGQD